MPSRGNAISAYSPAFSKGAQIYNANIASGTIQASKIAANVLTSGQIKMQKITSAVANSGVVYGLTHTLGVTPSIILFTNRGTVGQLKASATSANSVGIASVSAATSAKVYYAGAKNTGFVAYLIV